jgi:hypothetical protein
MKNYIKNSLLFAVSSTVVLFCFLIVGLLLINGKILPAAVIVIFPAALWANLRSFKRIKIERKNDKVASIT